MYKFFFSQYFNHYSYFQQQFSDQTINRLQTELRAKDEKINLLENEKSHIVVMLEAESRNLSKCEKARKELEVEVTLLNEQVCQTQNNDPLRIEPRLFFLTVP